MIEKRVQLLLLDDNQDLRRELKEFLEREFGYQVDAVGDRAAAVRLVEEAEGAYDVAMIDQLLAEGPIGIQVMQEIKRLDQEIEVIIFTGHEPKDRQEALRAGAFRFLEQPVNFDELADLIRIAAQQVKLREIGQTILSVRDLGRVLEEIVDAAASLASADDAAIVLLNLSSEKLEVHSRTQHDEPVWRRTLRESSISREIIETGEMFWIGNVEEDERVEPAVVESGICSLRGLPIPGEEGNLGVLYVYSNTPGRFETWGTISMLQTLAGQAGLALSNLQAFERLRDQAGYMEALVHTSRGLTQAKKLKKQMKLVDAFMCKQLHVSIFYVGLYNTEIGAVEVPLARDHGKRMWPSNLPLKDGEGNWTASGYVIETGQELFWESQSEKMQICDKLGVQTVPHGEPPAPQTCFYLPLMIEDIGIGLISIQSTERRAFSPEMLDAFRALASQLSVALENSRLLRSSRAATAQLSTLNEVVLEISKESNRSTLLQKVIEQATDLLDAQGATMFLLNPAGTLFERVAQAGQPLDFDGQVSPNEGLTGEVIRAGSALQVSDYQSWEKRLEPLRGQPLTAVAAAPIEVEGRVLGTVVVHDTRPGKQFDEQLLKRFADHAGLALQKAALLENLRGLQDLSTSITSILNLSEALDRTCQAAVELFGVEHSGLVLFDENLEWGTVQGEFPTGVGTVGTRIQVKEVPAEERLAHKGDTLNIPDVELADDELGPVLDTWREFGIRSVLIVPIIYRERILGSFSLDSIGHTREFTEEEEDQCKALAAQAAVAIENARLFGEAEAGRERLRAFFRASSALVSSEDLEGVLHDIVERACSAADARAVGMALIDRDNQVRDLIVAGMEEPEDWDEVIRPNDGLSMQVMASGRPLAIPDKGAFHGEINPSQFWEGVAAALCLPVVLEGDRVGVMWFFYDQSRGFAESQIEAAQLYVNHAALAYDSARRITELEHMRQAAEAMAGLAEVDDVLDQIATSARDLLGGDSAAIWSYDDVRGMLIAKEAKFAGIPAGGVQSFLKSEPREGGTALTVMERGWLGVTDVEDRTKHDFELGSSTRNLLASFDVRSFQGIALRVGDENLGVLYVNYNQPRSFGEKDKNTLATFAHHAALALKKARLLEQVKKAKKAAEVVAGVTVLGELGESLRAVVQGTKEAVGCDAVVLYVYDQDRGKLEHPPTMEGVRFPDKVRRGTEVPPRSIVYTMLRKNKLYIVERVAKDRLFSVTRFALEEEIESLVAIPLKAAAQKVGVMFVNYRTRHRFTEDELTNLELFSNQAAVAIQNAQLYHRSQRWAEVQEALYRASRIITGSLDLQEVIGHVAQQTWEVGSKPGEERALFSGVSLMEDGILTDVAAYPPESFEVFASMAAGIKLSPKAGQRIGILGRAVATRKSQVVGDVTRDPDYIEVDPRTRSELAVPLLVGREVIGAVILEHAEPDAFGSEEFIALSSLAAQAGLAIQHARLYQAERRHAQALESIQATSSAVSAILDLEELLPMITEEAAGIFSAPASSLMLWDERHESLVIRAACGLGDRYRQEQRIARSTVDRLIETRGLRPHVFDIAQEPLGRPDLIEEEQLRRALVAPLVKGEVLIGILCVYDREVPCPFSDKEQELARVFASHAAIAIQNAQLYDEISERAAVLQTLYEAGKAITSTLTPDEILNQIVKQALNLTRSQGQPTHFGHLALVEGNRIRFVAADTPQILEQLRKQVGEIDLHRTHQVGIVGRVAKTGIAQNVHDVSRHPDYILLRSSTHSQLSVPIVIGDRVIGVISAEHPECDAFDQEDQEALEHLAAQAAVAIQNARLYEQARIVADISREAARQLELTAFLETLFARLKLVFQERRIPVYLNLDTYDKDTNSLIPNPTAFYPAERPKVIPLTDSSLMAWVAETRKPYYAPDVSQDRRYHLRLPDTCSEFAVPVCFGDGLLGVLNLESPLRNAFTPEDQQLVRTLSDQVATTIHNVQQYEELRRIKGFVGSQTALEWMRMVSTAWGHSIKREVGTALASAGLLEQGIKKREQQRAIDELGDLKEILRKIGEIPLTAPLSAEDQVTPVRVNQTIEAYLRRLQGHPRHSLVSITHNLQPDLDDIVTVIASEGWLRRGLEIVVENAIQAMLDSDSDPKLLTVTTHLQDDWVQILVQDTGPGIPGEIRRKLFKERIPRSEGSLGAGIGLLLAKAIFETYQGRIEVLDCEPPGALLSILLPAERGV